MAEGIKSTGIVRQLDTLGRIVLPIEMRRTLDLKEKDGIEISVDGERIILQKYVPNCVLCGSTVNTQEFRGKLLCEECIRAISELR